MPIAKGTSGNPQGRPKGAPNKSTTNAREAVAAFVEGNTARLNRLLDSIENGIENAKGDGYIVYPNPKGAFDCIMNVTEYHIPKLNRTEATVSGPDGGPIQQEHRMIIDFTGTPDRQVPS